MAKKYRKEHPEKVREWKRAEYQREKKRIAAMDPETYKKYREEKNAKCREYRRRKKSEAEARLMEEEKIIQEKESIQNQTEKAESKEVTSDN
jgi:hypothetical protein